MQDEPTHDSIFGELEYDPPMEEWHAKAAPTPGHEIEIAIWWDETDGPFNPVRQIAAQAFKLFQACEGEHREQLAAAMLERYRRSTRPEERLPPATELAEGLVVESISIASDGSMSVYYDDSAELFADHSVVADIAADGTFEGFTLQG